MIAASEVLSPRSAACLPASLADVLVGLGIAANELSFAVAEARLREHRATLAVLRVSEREDLNLDPWTELPGDVRNAVKMR